MLAQSFLEYGFLGSFAAGVTQLKGTIWNVVADVPQVTWVVAGGILLIALWLWSRRRTR